MENKQPVTPAPTKRDQSVWIGGDADGRQVVLLHYSACENDL